MTRPTPILDARAACEWLRILADDAPPDQARSARERLYRLVREGRLRPITIGRQYLFLESELLRFAQDATEGFQLDHNCQNGDREPARGDRSQEPSQGAPS